MATLATICNRFLIAGEQARTAPRPVLETYRPNPFRLRAVPNEDVYFFVKRIDNSRVVREADPQALGTCWRFIALASMAAIVLIGMLLPAAYGLLAGYQIQSLQNEQQQLLRDQSVLDLELAKLLSPQRLEELARTQLFVDPAPDQVVYLAPKTGDSAAIDQKN
jgi:cell division protein FtsL